MCPLVPSCPAGTATSGSPSASPLPAGAQVALVHDWLNGMRGGERCLELIADLFPAADIYTLLYVPEAVSERIRRHTVHPSGLRRLPFFRQRYRYFLPLFPGAIERFRLSPETQLVVSTSHCVAKGIRPPPGAHHLCYCFTPMRYAWVLPDAYFGPPGSPRRRVIDPCLRRLRDWDKAASDRVDRFVAISRHVQARIGEFYGRESEVVYPPVDCDFFTPALPDGEGEGEGQAADAWPSTLPRTLRESGYLLVVSALVPYKRVDLAIEAAQLVGRPLVVAGGGSEETALRTLAAAPGANGTTASVYFAGRPSDAGIRELYRHCEALLFPGVEDFGIVPLEAQACGRPVLAFGSGGALETVLEGQTGLFFPEQSAEALADAIRRAAAVRWDAGAIRAHAETFAPARFLSGLSEQVAATLRGERL